MDSAEDFKLRQLKPKLIRVGAETGLSVAHKSYLAELNPPLQVTLPRYLRELIE